MDSLKDLTYLLNRYAVRDIDVLTNPDKKKSKEDSRYWEFYVGLQKGKWKTEDEIAKHFGYASKSDKGFRRLKDGLKERFLNSIIFLDIEGDKFSEFERKSQESFRLSMLAEWVYRRGSNSIYLDLAHKALSLAIEVGASHTVIYISSLLRGYYVQSPRYSKEFDAVSKIFNTHYEYYKLEMDAHSDCMTIFSSLNDKKGYKKEFAEMVETMFTGYEMHLEHKHGYMFQFYARMIQTYAKVLSHNWGQGVVICDNALTYFAQNFKNIQRHLIFFNTQKSTCLLMLKDYDNAFATLESSKNFIQEGKPFWFKNRELAAITCLYAERYQEAWDLVNMALNHERFGTISEVDQETWRLYQGYLYLIGRINKADYWAASGQAGKFRVSRWLNDLPLYSQDKRGGNIPLLILQILFLLTELWENPDSFDDLCNRVEALRKYGSRNLDPDEEHVRTNCFIGLVQLLPKHINNPSELQKASHKLFAKMQGVENDVVDTTYEVEVVPYERQWAWITDLVRTAASETA